MSAINEERTTLPVHNLDVLRSFAVLAVLSQHLASSTGHRSLAFARLGHAGVLMFFVHTALVLMASLERDGAPARPGWMRRFYVRRAFRIYPLAWVVIALVVLLRVPAGTFPAAYTAPSMWATAANVALVQNLAGANDVLVVLWTLPIELQMYALLPLCFVVARTDRGRWMTLMIAMGVAAAALYRFGDSEPHRIHGLWRLRVLDFVPCFLMGVLAYFLLRQRRAAALPWWSWPLIIVLNLGALVQWREHWTVSIAFCAILGIAIPCVRDARPSAYTGVAHTIAKYSYGIYLMHLLAFRAGFSLLRDWPAPVQWLTAAAVLMSGAYVGYHVVEQPAIAMGRRLARRTGQAATPH